MIAMPKIVPIVEGLGEVKALPNLLSKILRAQQCYDIFPDQPLNANGVGNLTKPGGIERFVRAAATRRDCGAILVLVDADRECALERPRDFSARLQSLVHCPIVIVAAKRMYENWILASAETLRGQRLDEGTVLSEAIEPRDDVESYNGKGELKSWLPEGRAYNEPIDQPTFTQLLDIELVHQRSRSFRRLWHALEEAIEAIRTDTVIVTPQSEKS